MTNFYLNIVEVGPCDLLRVFFGLPLNLRLGWSFEGDLVQPLMAITPSGSWMEQLFLTLKITSDPCITFIYIGDCNSLMPLDLKTTVPCACPRKGNPFYQWNIFVATQLLIKLYASFSRALLCFHLIPNARYPNAWLRRNDLNSGMSKSICTE